MKKDLPPQAGSILFIVTGSVDMNIKPLSPALLRVSRSPSLRALSPMGRRQPGREIFFFFSRK